MIKVHFFGMPIKTLGSLGKIRVGRVTGNTHIFYFGLMKHYAPNRCEPRIEVIVKVKKVGVGDVNWLNVKMPKHKQKECVGVGVGKGIRMGGCEPRIEVIVKMKKK